MQMQVITIGFYLLGGKESAVRGRYLCSSMISFRSVFTPVEEIIYLDYKKYHVSDLSKLFVLKKHNTIFILCNHGQARRPAIHRIGLFDKGKWHVSIRVTLI